jgi:P27 family predicted phage terminase small subunit
MPKTLDDEGRRVWRRIVPQLEAMGVLTHIDREKLERYCCLRSLFVKTLLFLAKAGDSRIVLSKDKKHIKSVTEYP